MHDGRGKGLVGNAGTPNTGGGGAGYGDGWTCHQGGAGGSGIVIISYKVPSATPSIDSTSVNSYSYSATLSALVNPNNYATTVTFNYGLTNGYGSSITASQGILNGYIDTNASIDISGLTPNTIYHYNVVATSVQGTATSIDGIFTTLQPNNAVSIQPIFII